jgi:hypothetical protein
VADYLRRANVGPFSTESSPSGTTRVFIVNPTDRIAISRIARGIHASHTAINGRADRIGADSGASAATGDKPTEAAARAGYRTVIRDAESAAGA